MCLKNVPFRQISFVVVILSLLAVFTACGGNSSQSGSSQLTADQANRTTANTSASGETEKKVDYTGTVTVLGWGGTQSLFSKQIAEFNKVYPDIRFNFIDVKSPTDLLIKIQILLSSGGELPDLARHEISVRGKAMSMNCWEDLSKPPYNVNKSDILDWVVNYSTDQDGKLIGLEESPAMAGLIYRRDLAQKYLGTDDPEELQKLLPTWDAFIESGKEIQAKSGNSAYMFASIGDALSVLLYQNDKPFVTGNKFTLDESLGEVFSMFIRMKQANLIDSADQWSPSWYANFTKENDIFFSGADWMPGYVVKPTDKNGSGKWGLMLPPEGGYVQGGTLWGIPQKAKNKELGFAFINWLLNSRDGAMVQRDTVGYFSAYKPVYDDKQFYTNPDPFFGGQDVLSEYAYHILPMIKGVRTPVKYDNEISDAINLVLKYMNSSSDPSKLSKDDLVNKVLTEVAKKYPELKK